MSEVIFPKMDQTMSTGVLVEWLVTEGTAVTRGQPIATIETDKVGVDLESPADGVISGIAYPAGSEVTVGAVLARVTTGAEERSGDTAEAPPDQAPQPVTPAPTVEAETSPGATTPTPPERTVVLPFDRRDWSRPHQAPPAQRWRDGTAATGPTPDDATRVELSRSHLAMVRQVTASAAIPQYQVSREVSLATALELVSEVRRDRPEHPLRITDLVVRALALAVDDVPEVNSRFAGDHLVRRRTVDINMLVAVGAELYNPCIHDVPGHTLTQLAEERRRVVAATRAGRLTPADAETGTCTLSNLGPLGVDQFTALVFPPQSLVVAMGRIRPPSEGATAWLTASADHRVLNGARTAEYLAAVTTLLERPLRLLVDAATETTEQRT